MDFSSQRFPPVGRRQRHPDGAGRIRSLLDERIDTKRADLVSYALQIASHNLPYVNFEPGPRKMVLEPSFEIQCLAKPSQPATPEPAKDAQALSSRTGSAV